MYPPPPLMTTLLSYCSFVQCLLFPRLLRVVDSNIEIFGPNPTAVAAIAAVRLLQVTPRSTALLGFQQVLVPTLMG